MREWVGAILVDITQHTRERKKGIKALIPLHAELYTQTSQKNQDKSQQFFSPYDLTTKHKYFYDSFLFPYTKFYGQKHFPMRHKLQSKIIIGDKKLTIDLHNISRLSVDSINIFLTQECVYIWLV
jgi:hypothetical protein